MDAPVPIAVRAAETRPRRKLSLLGDERLAALVGRGDQRAFATIYERYHQALYRYCRSILHNDADAQDAVQTAVVSAFVALQNGRRDAPLRPWLFRIAHNTAISALRRRRPTLDLMECDGPGWGSVEDRVEERHRLALLVNDLAELPERQRGALVMRELSGLSHEDIAVAMGVTVGAAKQAIFEARRALVEFQGGRELPCEQIQRALSDGDRRVIHGRRIRAHLHDCAVCTAFAEAIRPRREALQMLAPPLAPIAAGGLLVRLFGSGHGSGGAAAGIAAKSTTAALVVKTAAAVAVIATATVAVTHVAHIGAGTPPATHRPPALRGTSTVTRLTTTNSNHALSPHRASAANPHSRTHSTPRAAHSRSRTGHSSVPLGVGRPATIIATTPVGAAGVSSHPASARSNARGTGTPARARTPHSRSTTATTHGKSAPAHAKNAAKATATTTSTATTTAATTHGKSAQGHANGATGLSGTAAPATHAPATPASGATTPSSGAQASPLGQGNGKQTS